jgi:hypothetical protein
MKTRLFVLPLLLFIGSPRILGRLPNDPCDHVSIPDKLSVELERSFSDWRMVIPSDLDPASHDLWAKNYAAGCPGFVAGHFLRPDSLAYAFLLVPKDSTAKGYRLVTFSETPDGVWRPIILEKKDQYTPTSLVIRLAPPGNYKQAGGSKSVQTHTDGIISQSLGVGILVYYWNGSRFSSIITSN